MRWRCHPTCHTGCGRRLRGACTWARAARRARTGDEATARLRILARVRDSLRERGVWTTGSGHESLAHDLSQIFDIEIAQSEPASVSATRQKPVVHNSAPPSIRARAAESAAGGTKPVHRQSPSAPHTRLHERRHAPRYPPLSNALLDARELDDASGSSCPPGRRYVAAGEDPRNVPKADRPTG